MEPMIKAFIKGLQQGGRAAIWAPDKQVRFADGTEIDYPKWILIQRATIDEIGQHLLNRIHPQQTIVVNSVKHNPTERAAVVYCVLRSGFSVETEKNA